MNRNELRNLAGAAREELIQAASFASDPEETACIWFIRLAALRHMEVKGYLEASPAPFAGSFRALSGKLDIFSIQTPVPEEVLSGVYRRLSEGIPSEEWQPEMTGWLYQFFNEESKARVFSELRRSRKIAPESIPAATQLFTPEWIVRYMVDNTLGRLWLERTPGSPLRPELQYLAGEPVPGGQPMAPEEIRFIDPCMGSGHVLVYAFDLLMKIYLSAGRSVSESVRSVLRNNLYGLDIDRRALELTGFALMMKAMEYDPTVINEHIRLNIAEFSAADLSEEELASESLPPFDEQFRNCRSTGSLLRIRPGTGTHPERLRAAELLTQSYHIAVTNPPYMASSNMSRELSDFVRKNYYPGRADLFSAFMLRCTELTRPGGFTGMLTPYVWMFIQSYEELRRIIYRTCTVETLIQFEYSAFGDATVPICSFVLRSEPRSTRGVYLRLTDFRGGMEVQRQKALEALSDESCPYRYTADPKRFTAIDGAPAAYWVSSHVLELFEKGQRLAPYIDARIGMVTGDNARFLRLWHEVDWNDIERSARPGADPMEKKWYVLQKGGNCRFWYGGQEYVVNWENGGDELKNRNRLGKRVRSHNYNGAQQFKEGITWNSITSGRFSCRYSPEGFTYDAAGPLCEVPDRSLLYYILAYLASNTADYFFRLINPTLNFPAGYLGQLPFVTDEQERVTELARENVELAREDWDSFETSWDFKAHPLL